MNRRRNLNVILFVVAVFFLLTSLMFYFYLQKVDSIYTQILSKQVESFHKLRTITKLSNSNFLFVYQAYLKQDVNTDSLHTLWMKGMTKNSENFTKLYQTVNTNRSIDSIYRVLVQSRQEYKNACNQFFNLQEDGVSSKNGDFFAYTVQLRFHNYQVNLDNFTELYKAQIEKESDYITANIHKDSLRFLFFGFSPIALVITIILFLLLVVFGFIWSFNLKIISLDI